jgi:hypothetical protein
VKQIKIGSRGDEVKLLQQRLAAKGFLPGGQDGVFGPQTCEHSPSDASIVPGRRQNVKPYVKHPACLQTSSKTGIGRLPGRALPAAVARSVISREIA